MLLQDALERSPVGMADRRVGTGERVVVSKELGCYLQRGEGWEHREELADKSQADWNPLPEGREAKKLAEALEEV